MQINSLLQILQNVQKQISSFLFSLTSESFLYYLAYGFIVYVLFHTLRMIFILTLNKQLAQTSKSWSLPTKLGKKQILILGDSTAVGTGADAIQDTIGGRLMFDFPDAQITNLGKNGGLIKDVSAQIKQVAEKKFDLIIISVGGNDVINLTSKKTVCVQLVFIFKKAKEMSDGKVFFLLYNNLGDAPIFPGIIRFFLKKRCRNIHNQIMSTTFMMRVPLIEIFSTDKNNPFLQNPKTFFAEDGIHPSSLGYRLWYNRMWLELVRQGFRL